MTDISEPKFDPDRLKKAHRLMEWSNIIVIGILITHRFWAGLILGGCFFGLFSMLPLAVEMYRMRRKERQNECKAAEEAPGLPFIYRGARLIRSGVLVSSPKNTIFATCEI